jgi:hypothetical protein
MFDFLDKFKEDKEINEGLFDKIFGQKKTEPAAQTVPEPENIEPEIKQEPKVDIRKPQKQPKIEFERGKPYEYDLTRIPILGKFSNPIINLSFKSPEDFKAFKAIMFYLNAGYFDNDIHNLQRAIKYGEIDGFGPFPYLSSIFNNNKGTTFPGQTKSIKEGNIKFKMPAQSTLKTKPVAATPASNVEGYSTMDSMRRLEKFVKYFVENIVDVNGNPNKVLKSSIISRIKRLLGTSIQVPKKPVQAKSVPIEPGAKPEDIEKSGEDVINYALKGLREGIQQEVRNILKDNF